MLHMGGKEANQIPYANSLAGAAEGGKALTFN